MASNYQFLLKGGGIPPELEQGKYEMNLESCCAEGMTVVFKMIGTCQKNTGANLKRLPVTKCGTI
jgi:hypothetical protein